MKRPVFPSTRPEPGVSLFPVADARRRLLGTLRPSVEWSLAGEGTCSSEPSDVFDEITVTSQDLPEALSFGPVSLRTACEGPVDSRNELPVTLTPRCYDLGVQWYRERYRTRGAFEVQRDRISFRPTEPIQVERAALWRRLGFRLLGRFSTVGRVGRVGQVQHARAGRAGGEKRLRPD